MFMKKIFSILLMLSFVMVGFSSCDDDSDSTEKTPLDSPSVSTDETHVSSLSFSWATVECATQYAYELVDENSNIVTGGVTSSTSVIVTGLASNTSYTLNVWAFADVAADKTTSPTTSITAKTDAIVPLDQPDPAATTAKGVVTISWPAVAYAASYKYSYIADDELIEGETTTNSVTLSNLAIGEYTITIYAVSGDEAHSDSEPISLTFTRAKAELWRKSGTYVTSATGASYSAEIVSYDDGSYTIEAPYGEEGYAISFTTTEGSTEITALDAYYESGGYYYYSVSADGKYVAIYTGSGFSEFSGDSKSGEVKFYAYLYDSSDNSIGAGYDDFKWGGSSKPITIDQLVGTYSAAVKGSDYFSSDWSVQSVDRTDEVEITANADGTITIHNFYDWGDDFIATVDLNARTISIPATAWATDYTFASITSNSSAVVAVVNADNTITFSDFTAWYGGYYYINEGTTCVMTKKGESLTVGSLVGTYDAAVSCYDYFTFTDWELIERTDEVTISANEDGTVTISNFYDWGEDFVGTVDLDARTITIEPVESWGGYYTFASTTGASDPVVAVINADKTISVTNFGAWYNDYSYIYSGSTCVLTKR